METSLNDFFNISISGRFAYGILCLETVFFQRSKNLKAKVHSNSVSLLISQLHSIVENNEVSNLEFRLKELLPSIIMENHPDNNLGEYKCYPEEQLNQLKKLYESLPEIVLDLIDCAIEVMYCNLYSSTQGNSPCSLKELSNVFETMKGLKIDLPRIPKYILDSKFRYKNGWGYRILATDNGDNGNRSL